MFSRPVTTWAILGVLCAFKLTVVYLCHPFSSNVHPHKYTADDTPRRWPVATHPQVVMQFDDTRRLTLEDTQEANDQWAAQYPNDGFIHLGDDKEPFTVSMFHEIRCLDIIRKELILRRPGTNVKDLAPEPGKLAMHCLNYVRQMVLCRADNNPEATYRGSSGPLPLLYRCNDWTKVYDEVNKNQRAYSDS